MGENGLQSGGEYTATFQAVSTVFDGVAAVFGQVAANKYVRPAAFINHEDVVVEEQHAEGGWKLIAVFGGLLFLGIGALVVGLIKPKK